MAILTTPQFYYVDRVTNNNRFLNFNDPGLVNEVSVEVSPSAYSPTELMTAVASAMNSAGTQIYTVLFDRTTRLVTISSVSNFDLLPQTGANIGLGIFPLLGFTTDRTGSNTYTADLELGDVYIPQFPLQDFRGFEDNEESIDASINESASGVIEVISFGRRRKMSFNIRYIKDADDLCTTSPYGNDTNAVQNARDFLSFCVGKGRLEFMKDKTVPGTFDVVLLESTNKDRNGTSYELRELYNIGIGFYESGKLTFRKVQ